MKRQVTCWKKIVSIHISDKGFVFGIYNELIQIKKTQNKKMAEDENRYFAKEDVQIIH